MIQVRDVTLDWAVALSVPEVAEEVACFHKVESSQVPTFCGRKVAPAASSACSAFFVHAALSIEATDTYTNTV